MPPSAVRRSTSRSSSWRKPERCGSSPGSRPSGGGVAAASCRTRASPPSALAAAAPAAATAAAAATTAAGAVRGAGLNHGKRADHRHSCLPATAGHRVSHRG